MRMKPLLRPAAWLVLASAPLWAAAAPTTMELRYFDLQTSSTFNNLPRATEGQDAFNNGNPYTGISYESSFNGVLQSTTAGGYSASSFTAGAERSGAAADFAGTTFGVGGLSFRRGDATLNTSNLTPAPYNSYSLSLIPSVPTGSALGLVSTSAGFGLESVWNFSLLHPGESIALATSGTGFSGDYAGRLQVRYFTNYQTGLSYFAFEEQSRTAGVLTRTTLAQVEADSVYADLADVDYISLQLERDMPTAVDADPQVHARVALLDASLDSNGDLRRLASFDFGGVGSSFRASTNGFSSPFVFASWLDPEPVVASVPEPGSLALAAAALLGLGALRRRAAR